MLLRRIGASLGLVLASLFLLHCLESGCGSEVGFAGCPGRFLLGVGHVAHRSSRSVTLRRGKPSDPQSTNPNTVLMSKIKTTASTMELLALIDKELEGQGFDQMHMSATFTRAASLGIRRMDATSSTWPKLAKKLRAMLRKDKISEREASNVLRALAEVHQDIGIHMDSIVPALVRCVQDKARHMKPRRLSNSLFAIAKLQKAAPAVLMAVPAIAEHLMRRVKKMKPQMLSNSLWAAANLQEAAPAVLMAVPAIAIAIAEHTSQKAEGMGGQQLSNCLWAAANLQEVAPAVLVVVPAIVGPLTEKAEKMPAQNLWVCLRAAAQLQDAAPAVLMAVRALAKSVSRKAVAFDREGLSSSLWALAMLQDAEPDVLTPLPDIRRQIFRKMQAMTVPQLEMCLWAAVDLGEEDLNAKLQAELARQRPQPLQLVEPMCPKPYTL